MVFSSLPFLFVFLPVALLACKAAPKRARNAVLLVFNLVFYAYGEPAYILLMLASIAVNYVFGLLIEKSGGSRKKLLLAMAAALNITALGIFKYAGLITGTLRNVPVFAFIPLVSFQLPIGISFYTFQALSYEVDVYRGECRAERNLAGFAAYISLFPQLIAGPIVRYSDIAEELHSPGKAGISMRMGVRLFAAGLSKKVLLANQLGMLWDGVSQDPAAAGAAGAWLGIAAYSLQLYFDFSGYSDMARGLGAMLGFSFCNNFNYPYISKSITEFWRRWHISLSGWFRDYVYFPLGGSRCKVGRMCVNLLATWLLTGLWHGAGWNFLFWGFYYGVLLILEKLVLKRILERLPGMVQRAYTLFAVAIGWIFFASGSFGAAWAYLKAMFSLTPGTVAGGALSWAPLLAVSCAAATPLGAKYAERLSPYDRSGWGEAALVLAALILSTASLVSQSYNPFLYFRF